jgi:S-adenosylmethionine:tRNA ribosyltransferase-isomerase
VRRLLGYASAVNSQRLDDYDFELPPELIAQSPPAVRTAARLMTVARGRGHDGEATIAALPELLRGDELLVLNDTRVVPARLHGTKDTGGRVELLVIEATGPTTFRALGRASKGFSPGQPVALSDGTRLTIVRTLDDGHVQVARPDDGLDLWAFLDRCGELPLPPYIARPEGPDANDAERYQTVYAERPGSVAAPTAGLHFTPALLSAVEARGCAVTRVTLHVGPGTFAPVHTNDLSQHRMHAERFAVPEDAARAIAEARAARRPLLAVGTTVVRTLEAVAARHDGAIPACSGETDIFIREGHAFRAVDQLLTNFHLPRSTLLVLVSAFAGRDVALSAYREAVARGFRFFSFGDAMLLR